MPGASEIRNWDQRKFDHFQRTYNRAVRDGKGSFDFDGKPYLTVYAKLVIEYLEGNFNYVSDDSSGV